MATSPREVWQVFGAGVTIAHNRPGTFRIYAHCMKPRTDTVPYIRSLHRAGLHLSRMTSRVGGVSCSDPFAFLAVEAVRV
jgi:hypothetical protein